MVLSNLNVVAGLAAIGFMTFVVVAMVYLTLASTRNDRHSPVPAE